MNFLYRKVILALWGAFMEPVSALFKVYENKRCLFAGLSLTGMFAALRTQYNSFWESFKVAFDRDHNVSFEISMTILLFVFIDSVLGFWKHWKLKTTSSEGWGKLLTKLILYYVFVKVVDKLIFFEQIKWVGDLFLSGIVIREAISIFENMGVIYPGIIPGFILKRLKQFDDNGIFKDKEK